MELAQLNLILDLILKILGLVVLAGALVFIIFVTSLIIRIRLQLITAKKAIARIGNTVQSGVLTDSVVKLFKVGFEEKFLSFLIDRLRGVNKK